MNATDFLTLPANGPAAAFSDIPVHDVTRLGSILGDALVSPGRRVLACFALPKDDDSLRLVAVLGAAAEHTVLLASSTVGVDYPAYPALTPEVPALHWFEREIAEQYGITPTDHPWLKPIRFHKSWTPGRDAWQRPDAAPIEPGVVDNFTVEGGGEHEVAVGPVHAGVIEPGHFRFQCLGEDVHHLEISLGYQHRGIEKLLEGGPDPRALHYAETAVGDTTIASAWNYAAIIESLSGIQPSADTLRLRAILLELERMANHVGDLGALAGDVAYLPTQAYCGRIRGDYLNMTADIAGNRFGRNVVVPGGMRQPLEPGRSARILADMRRVKRDLDLALKLLFNEPSALDRFEGTGPVDAATARAIGLVGVAGRASGLALDARHDFPHPGAVPPPRPALGKAGDVFNRMTVRRDEIEASHARLFRELEAAAKTGLTDVAPPPPAPLQPDAVAIAVTEAWRGELVHVAITDGDGRFRRYKIVDPSFHNWFGLALALRGEQISHFPICNKSFNLSYCGHDL
ncbi:MAG: NADH-quinone oxidoreductase subunit C [Kiritimatiellia bacterium]|jgi:Ni,Fe-hydrogenase III large subunit